MAWTNVAQGACVWCSSKADRMEYVPPLAMTERAGAELYAELGIALLMVPSCAECKATLGTRELLTVAARLAALTRRAWAHLDWLTEAQARVKERPSVAEALGTTSEQLNELVPPARTRLEALCARMADRPRGRLKGAGAARKPGSGALLELLTHDERDRPRWRAMHAKECGRGSHALRVGWRWPG